MKVGITGGRGVLGAISSRLLEKSGCEVSLFGGNICFVEDIREWLKGGGFDAVIHYAAMVPVDKVKASLIDAYRVNVGGTINLLSALKGRNERVWFFYASTSHVYESSAVAISEKGKVGPISAYGKTKAMAEEVCLELARQEGEQGKLEICCGRIFSFYHSTQKGSFLYPSIRNRLEREELGLVFRLRGGDCVRDFLDAEDVCSIVHKLMRKRSTGVFNIGSGKPTKIRDFVQSLSKKKLVIESEGEANSIVSDISKLKAEIN